jgi:glycosyltransferase involved in cell wall biosynthesis
MKICIAIYDCMDLGGIINHTEHLAAGFREIGHDVDFLQILYKDGAARSQRDALGAQRLGTGVPYRQGAGWTFPADNRVTYWRDSTKRARQKLGEYDIVIWTVPVPPKNKPNLGNDVWPELYDLSDVKQIAISHDGNAARGYPHLLHVAEKLAGLACVHPCAMNTCEFLPIPRAMIVNPQQSPLERKSRHWDDRHHGFINAQTFKAWKHAHELIGAIRYMSEPQPQERRYVIGKGIEYQYLTSQDKCKPQYFHADGERFWDSAEANGMEHHDYVDEQSLMHLMGGTRAVVDPSWSDRYAKKGGHFNRVLVEAMMNGCVPVARLKGVGDDFFKPNEDYIAIPEDADLQQYAEFVEQAGHASEKFRDAMEYNYRPKLAKFDRRRVAQDFIDLAMGEHVSAVTSYTRDVTAETKSDDILFEHFDIL